MGNALRKQPAPGVRVDLDELFLQLERQRSEGGGRDSAAAQTILSARISPASTADPAVEAALFFVMGMSGWWTANAIVAETPIFVAETPEEQAIGNLLESAELVEGASGSRRPGSRWTASSSRCGCAGRRCGCRRPWRRT